MNSISSRHAILVIALGVFAYLANGMITLALPVAAALLQAQWHINHDTLGLLFSAGFVGMAAGGLTLPSFADTLGRHRIAPVSFAICAAGALIGATASSSTGMAISRLLTGFGVGAGMPCITALLSEVVSSEWRGLAIALMGSGFPGGAAIAAWIEMRWGPAHGWPVIFHVATAALALLVPVLALLMPASRPAGAQAGAAKPARPLAILFAPDFRRMMISLCLVYGFFMFSEFFVLNWAPKLLVERGIPQAAALSAMAALNIGGIIGGILGGVMLRYFRAPLVGGGAVLGFSASILALGLLPLAPAWLPALTFACGLVMFVTLTCMYTAVALAVPRAAAATGFGLAETCGRIGAITSPSIGGILLSLHVGAPVVIALFAVPVLVAGPLLMGTRGGQGRSAT